MSNFGTPQPLHFNSDEVTLTPITVPKAVGVATFDASTPNSNNVVTFQTPSSDGSFVSTSFELAPVDLSPMVSNISMTSQSGVSNISVTSQSGASLKGDLNSEPVEKVTENDSLRDLIMSAISVMKSRKARPDTRRYLNQICRIIAMGLRQLKMALLIPYDCLMLFSPLKVVLLIKTRHLSSGICAAI